MNIPVSAVRIGGLFRCCVDVASKTIGIEGQIITCPHCKEKIVYVKGAWEWASRPTPS